jgi:tetratricopeptide (TPR) repeat protein
MRIVALLNRERDRYSPIENLAGNGKARLDRRLKSAEKLESKAMRRHLSINAIVLATLLMALTLASCGGNGSGKIPITTSSEEALKYYLQARTLQENIRNQESIEFYEKAIEADPGFASAHMGLSIAFFSTNATAGFESLNRAAALADNVSEGERLWIKGFEASLNGNPARQAELLQELVRRYHSDERTHTYLGNHHFEQQEYALAITEFRKAKEINPDYAPLYNMLGYSYRRLGKYKAAEAAFKTYIKLIPNNANPYDSYAELLMKIGEYEESIEHYEKALEINQEFGSSHTGIATNLIFLGKHDEARAHLREWYDGTEEVSQQRVALFGMAVSYADEGRLEKALEKIYEQYQVSVAAGNNVGMLGDLTLAGNILLEMGRPDDATASYDRGLQAFEAAPGIVEAVKDNARAGRTYTKVRVAIAKGDLEGAKAGIDEYQGQTEATQSPVQIRLLHEMRGMIALEEKDYDKAIEELQQANQRNTYNLYRMMLAYEGMGDREGVREMSEEVANFNQFMNLNYGFVRQKARKRLASI